MMMFLYGVTVTLMVGNVLLMGAGWWMRKKIAKRRKML